MLTPRASPQAKLGAANVTVFALMTTEQRGSDKVAFVSRALRRFCIGAKSKSLIRGESEGSAVINYNTRLLGRKGVMEVNLVIDPEKLKAALPAYAAILKDYSYKSGERYAEYRAGDKLAKYGLAALITGGAAAVAVKTGLFGGLLLLVKKAWKVVVVAVAALAAWCKRLISGGRNTRSEY